MVPIFDTLLVARLLQHTAIARSCSGGEELLPALPREETPALWAFTQERATLYQPAAITLFTSPLD